MKHTNFGIGYSQPFPHTVIDDFLSPETVRQINAQWPREWTKEAGKNNNKWHTQNIPDCVQEVVSAIDIAMVEQATGITGLFADPELFGAGLHCIPPGGFLKLHCDFNVHPKRSEERRVGKECRSRWSTYHEKKKDNRQAL